MHHACEVFEGLHIQHKPMTFKFGFTHCAHFRWHNMKFGYKHAADKFQCMVVVYAAANPFGPAFLEASLIRQYGSFSSNLCGLKRVLSNFCSCVIEVVMHV